MYVTISKSQLGYNALHEFECGRLCYVAGPSTIRSPWFKEFEYQARWLVKEYKQGHDQHGRRRLTWYVDESKGHDDFMTAWFLALMGADIAQRAEARGGYLFLSVPTRSPYPTPQLPKLPPGMPPPRLRTFE